MVDIFWKFFLKRSLYVFLLVIILILCSILRFVVVATTDYGEYLSSQGIMKIKISNLRGTIYDCNMVPITNNKSKIIAAVYPTVRAITAISAVLKGEEKENVLEILKSGKPTVCEVPEIIECEGISCSKIIVNDTSTNIANHLIGYTDSENNGVTGLQKAYNDILYSADEITAIYETDGKGEILKGTNPKIEYNSSVLASGVVSTIDVNIQNILERNTAQLKSGAIVIAECKNNKIRGMLSLPNYNKDNIEEYLNDTNSPLLNKAINNYNVGSVFKPCVAIAGLENNINDFWYDCTGKTKIGNRYFKCHELNGHGIIGLDNALAKSCNTYFYNYGIKIGGEKIYNTAKSLGFGSSIKLCDGLTITKGTIPEPETLKNEGNIANFSIGQGVLTASPINMLNLYSAIANGGKYYVPSVVEAVLNNGKKTDYDIGNPTVVSSKNNADKLREYLKLVFEIGTAKEIKQTEIELAGKTATAQTGRYDNGVEICEGWFCGFFPADNPKYTVIVFSEDISKDKASLSEIFVNIAEDICKLKNIDGSA